MLRIFTVVGHKRMSTQDLLQKISQAVAEGETDFYIAASGQHDIGGPCWNAEGKPLRFTISNPGQRAGAMCLPGTQVVVDGPAPADVGWLNSGGHIVVKGDAGDTAGHCAAAGKIYIGGRAGTRSGSLMKHDPLCAPPELWILKNTGSFSFEFMGGGFAVVCGHDSQTLPSVLGERPCVGMVAGVVYFRGPHGQLPDDVIVAELTEDDITWLNTGLDVFLADIDRQNLRKELSVWRHWRKLLPVCSKAQKQRASMREFHAAKWFKNGLFGDILPDDGEVAPLCATGLQRLQEPVWRREVCMDCRKCLEFCPNAAIRRRRQEETAVYCADAQRCTGCGICAAICPKGGWQMRAIAGGSFRQ